VQGLAGGGRMGGSDGGSEDNGGCDVFISYLEREALQQALALQKALQGMGITSFVPRLHCSQSQIDKEFASSTLPVILGTARYGEIDESGESRTLDEAMKIKRRWRDGRKFALIRMCDNFESFETRQHLPMSQFEDISWTDSLVSPPSEVIVACIELFQKESSKGRWEETMDDSLSSGPEEEEVTGPWLIEDVEGREFWQLVFDHHPEGESNLLRSAIAGNFQFSESESCELVDDRILNTPPDTPPPTRVLFSPKPVKEYDHNWSVN